MRTLGFVALSLAVTLAVVVGKFFGLSWVDWKIADD
jgi:hypothetical protein